MQSFMKFKDIPDEAKPREKALKKGVRSLTSAEIIALFLRTGTRKNSVLVVAQKLLEKIGGITELTNLTYKEITEIEGVGKVKALELLASFELVRRIKSIQVAKVKIEIKSPHDIYQLVEYDFEQIDWEQFHVILLNKQNQLINRKQLYQGSKNQILIDLRDIFEFALENKTRKIICVHNHPSGNSSPSKEDLQTTEQIQQVAAKLNIFFLDHLIFGRNEFYSIKMKKKIYLSKSKEKH